MLYGKVLLQYLDFPSASYRPSGGHRVLPEGDRKWLQEELEEVIADRRLLVEHLRVLQESGSRIIRQPFSQERHQAILCGGLGILDDGALADLARNPAALLALHNGLYGMGDLPLVWRKAFDRLEREELASGRNPTPAELLRRAGIRANS